MKFFNTQKRNLWISYAVAIAGAVVSLYPEFSGMNSSDSSAFLILFGMFIALSGWIAGLLMFKEKARIMDEAQEERFIVAKWVYDSSSWRRKIVEEKQLSKTASLGIILMVLLIGSLVGIPLIVSAKDMVIAAAVYAVLLSFGLMGAFFSYRKLKYMQDKAYVVIIRDGAVLNGEAICWRGRGRCFKRAKYNEKTHTISVSYSKYYGKGQIDKTVAIPIPTYVDVDAREIVKKINMGDYKIPLYELEE